MVHTVFLCLKEMVGTLFYRKKISEAEKHFFKVRKQKGSSLFCMIAQQSTPIIAEVFIQKRRQRSSPLFGGKELIKVLAALVVLHQDGMKKRMICTRMV